MTAQTTPPPFRELAAARLARALGPPQVLSVGPGQLVYRWALARPGRPPLGVVLNSPDITHLAHLIVSDPASASVSLITSVTVRTPEELETVVGAILAQWRSADPP